MSGDFLRTVLEFKKDNITEESIELMEPYLRMEDYNFKSAQQVCGNVAGLLSWTVAMTNFYSINKDVLPLKVGLHFYKYLIVEKKKEEENKLFLL
jgi:dynein heavy chain